LLSGCTPSNSRAHATRSRRTLGALGRESVDLIEEDDGSCGGARSSEERRHRALTLAHVLR